MPSISQNQMELFLATATDLAPKEQQDLMARNWFSLARQKRTEPIEHYFGKSWVKIKPTDGHGIATIFDNDVIIFALSHYMDAVNKNNDVGRRFY